MRGFSVMDTALDEAGLVRARVAQTRSAAMWGYLLLRPGLEFVRQRSNFILGWRAAAAAGGALAGGVSAGAVGRAGAPPLGSWMNLPDLTSPATRTVLPSHDALYGAAHLELGLQGPFVVSVPAAPDDRYYSVAVMDAHMNNVTHLGPRWTGTRAVDVLLAPPGWQGSAPVGMTVVRPRTGSLALYNRMLVRYEPGDLDVVRAWQAALRLTPLAQWGSPDPEVPDVDTSRFEHPDLNTLTDEFAYLRIGLDHLARNPMVVESDWLVAMVRDADLLSAEQDPPLRDAVIAGVGDGIAMLDAELTCWPRVNGWMKPDPRLGLPNPDVAKSAAFQQFQIGANDIAESAYSFVDTTGDGAALDGAGGAVHALRFGPGQLPPHHPSGYWSVTMYGRDSLLVANPADWHEVRPDRPGFALDADRGATIVLAATRPDGVPEGNWLPAPQGPFRLGLRVYYPTDAVTGGAWVPPPVTRQAP